MGRCTRKGCGRDFVQGSTDTCTYHSGSPVFHEGLKSWSCCSEVNKPVLEFDEFMKIPGCTQISGHTIDIPESDNMVKPLPTSSFTISESASGQEVYSGVQHSTPVPASITPPPPAPIVEEEEDLDAVVEPGTKCRRNGCDSLFISDEISRQDGGGASVCTYHPAPPIFREGSKGYLCCKRRVLEFDEFLKIRGCKTGRHIFSPIVTKEVTEEMVTCRVDHYQTRDKVHVSVFARQSDKERSKIIFDEKQVTVDLHLPGAKRFTRVLDLFGPIDPAQSNSQFFGTKVELHLQKADARSWTLLESTAQDYSHINLTFGVSGRTGTVGAKEVVLDETNKARKK